MSTMNRVRTDDSVTKTFVISSRFRPTAPRTTEGAHALSWAYAPKPAWSWGESNPHTVVAAYLLRTRDPRSGPISWVTQKGWSDRC